MCCIFLCLPCNVPYTYSGISQKEGEEYVLPAEEDFSAPGKVPWDLRYQCKHQEAYAVFFPVMSMDIAFRNQKGEYREGSPSYVVEHEPDGDFLVSEHEQGFVHVEETSRQKCCDMVEKHRKARKEFKYRAAHDEKVTLATPRDPLPQRWHFG